ncbi:MAG: hypothetical protein CVU97_00415 [Firmicutes bacterium HGW-Firmicutes-21]|nr:MAG: hypothetical protein CVU97_00415 [Firmicutes bacterium HGW-Firmicutes-21]
MFFTKNETTALQDEVIKKTLTDKDGKTLLYINITYPSFTLKDKNKLKQNAQPFYERSAKKFLHFAEGDLLDRAKKLSERDAFRPLGAVMKYTNAFEDKHMLSLYTEISVFDGVNAQNQLRSAQVWSKDKGYIYSFGDIFCTGTKEYLIERFSTEGNSGNLSAEEYKKCLKHFFNESNFYLTQKAAAFFYPAERLGGRQGLRVFYVDFGTLIEKKLLKVSV